MKLHLSRNPCWCFLKNVKYQEKEEGNIQKGPVKKLQKPVNEIVKKSFPKVS